MEDNRTIKELAQEALDVQNACNLLGVVNSFNRALKRLRDLESLDTDGLRYHYITQAWVSKISDLCGNPNDRDLNVLSSIFDNVEKLAGVK